MSGGVPSSGDRLAEIEHRARQWAEDKECSDNAIIELWRLQGRALAVDALALVEIAEAARVVDELSAAMPVDLDAVWTACEELHRKLARLDSGAAE